MTSALSGSEPLVAVVVPTRNRPDGLRRLVGGLEGQTLPRALWELVIVDDSSDEPTALAIKEITATSPLRIRALRTDHCAGGPAPVRNLGWRATDAPFLAFTDDDCIPQPGWLAAGLAALEGGADVGLVQGRTIRPPGSENYPYSCY